MGSRINRVPRGLQDLLNSVNLGVNPSDLQLTVQPGVDLFPFWASEKLAMYGEIGVAPAANTDVDTYIIPNGEAWMPITWSIRAVLVTVGDVISFGGRIEQNGMFQAGPIFAEGVFEMFQNRYVAASANDVVTIVKSWQKSVLFGPGNRFTTRVALFAPVGAAGSIVSNLYMYRFAV